MVGITAEQARELAIGFESNEVVKLLTKSENAIAEKAKRGYLNEHIFADSATSKAVINRVVNILTSRGFKVVLHPTAIEVDWGE